MKKQKSRFLLSKLGIIFFIFINFASANSNTNKSKDINSSLTQKQTITFQLSYNRINDAIDIFNIKKTQIGSSNYGSMGDSIGVDLKLDYKIDDVKLTLMYDGLNIHYIDNMLKNRKLELLFSIDFPPYYKFFFDNNSIDFGFITNYANDLDIKSDSTLNSMLKKIKPNGSFYTSDGALFYDNKTVILLDRYGNKIYPFIKISNMSDSSVYTRYTLNKEFNNNKIDIHSGVKLTKIKTTISLEPKDNNLLQDAIESLKIPSLYRSEIALFGGIKHSFKYKTILFENSYEYIRVFQREDDVSYNNKNHFLNTKISKKLTDNFTVFLKAKAMLNQFNSIIPYLYNRYTKTKYDKKYGYATIGFILNFDIIEKK